MRYASVNGRFVRRHGPAATVSIDDRALLFADGVYEVIARFKGHFFDLKPHLDRLERSLDALEMAPPMSRAALALRLEAVARRNRVTDGIVYLQISRGVAPRDHYFPRPAVTPGLIITAKTVDWAALARKAQHGVAVVSAPDIRWGRVDIKAVALLPNVLAKEAARRAGAGEVWLTAGDGVDAVVREGGSTNAWIVTADGALVTHPPGPHILRGVMRDTLVRLARADGLTVIEQPFTLAQAQEASEAFFTSTTQPCMPVIALDGVPVGTGVPGPVAQRCLALVQQEIARRCA